MHKVSLLSSHLCAVLCCAVRVLCCAVLQSAQSNADGGDETDAGEAFEKMQLSRLTASDPDSAAYHAALRRTAAAPVRSSTNFGGVKAAADATRKREHEALVNAGLAR